MAPGPKKHDKTIKRRNRKYNDRSRKSDSELARVQTQLLGQQPSKPKTPPKAVTSEMDEAVLADLKKDLLNPDHTLADVEERLAHVKTQIECNDETNPLYEQHISLFNAFEDKKTEMEDLSSTHNDEN